MVRMTCSSKSAGGRCCSCAAASINPAKPRNASRTTGPQIRNAIGNAGSVEQRLAPLSGMPIERGQTGFPQTPAGDTDGSEKGLVVRGIRDQAQVRQQVFDFPPLVKADGTDQTVGYPGPPKGFLQSARLGIGAVKHCHFAIRTNPRRHFASAARERSTRLRPARLRPQPALPSRHRGGGW